VPSILRISNIVAIVTILTLLICGSHTSPLVSPLASLASEERIPANIRTLFSEGKEDTPETQEDISDNLEKIHLSLMQSKKICFSDRNHFL
jgi:hypothetical protein